MVSFALPYSAAECRLQRLRGIAGGRRIKRGERVTELEYKTIAAPRKAPKVKGVRGADERLAYAIGEIIQGEAAEGWRLSGASCITWVA